MKLKINLKKKAEKPAKKSEVKASKNVITAENFHAGSMYVGRKIPTGKIRAAAVGLAVPSLPHTGYLILHGDKPGILVLNVKHDGENIYSHTGDDGVKRYGSVKAINGLERKGFYAEFTDLAGLKALAKKFGKAATVTRVSDDAEFKVALLNSAGDQYVAALAKTDDGLEPMVLEHPEAWNNKDTQYRFGKDIALKAVLA